VSSLQQVFTISLSLRPIIPCWYISPERMIIETLNLVEINFLGLMTPFSDRKVKGQGDTGRLNTQIDAELFHFTVQDVRRRSALTVINVTSCRRAAAKICPAQACSRNAQRQPSARPAEPGPISQYAPSSRPAAHAARRPDVRDRRQTDVRLQTERQTSDSIIA